MPFKTQVGPPRITIHQGHAVLVTGADGQLRSDEAHGLYFFDTRLISSWRITANGETWELLNGGEIAPHASRVFLANRPFNIEGFAVPARTMGMVISRLIDQGMHEDIEIANYGRMPIRFMLEFTIQNDFADVFEVRSGRFPRRGRIATRWSDKRRSLTTEYRHADFHRSLTIEFPRDVELVDYANGRVSMELAINPGATTRCCLLYRLANGGRALAAPEPCVGDATHSPEATALTEWERSVMKIDSSDEEFYRFVRQAKEDIAALRLPLETRHGTVQVPAAGLPWFLATFGRDSLITSLQTMPLDPRFATASLDVLASLQASETDEYRDAEPGKIPHEIRYGELAHFHLVPHYPYYGTADATLLFLIVLHRAWKWIGATDLLRLHLSTAENCLAWIDEFGDRDGDGFQEYQTRSPVGYENMSWKDSSDAVTDADGHPVNGPKALCELQGYTYSAWIGMAEIYQEIGRDDAARRLRQKAAQIYQRFNARFWDETSGYYAFALDGDKRPVWTVTSNVGHCLFCGIVPHERARRVAARLMAPDMASGWGIRTLSSLHPVYNPFSYHTGSVWPHDNSIIAMGMKRYGLTDEVGEIARNLRDAASHFALHQLPELYAGIQREQAGFPVQCPTANAPQSWAAGSAFALLQALLGLQPDAPRRQLYVDPVLPQWLPDITLRDLRLGDQTFDIRFRRTGSVTDFRVLKGDPRSIIHRSTAAELCH